MGLTAAEFSDLYYNTMKKYSYYNVIYGAVAITATISTGVLMGKRYGALTGFAGFVIVGGLSAVGFDYFSDFISKGDKEMLRQRFQEMQDPERVIVAETIGEVQGALNGFRIGGVIGSSAPRSSTSANSQRPVLNYVPVAREASGAFAPIVPTPSRTNIPGYPSWLFEPVQAPGPVRNANANTRPWEEPFT